MLSYDPSELMEGLYHFWLDDINQEIFNLRLQLATGKIENPSRIRFLRRDIARLKTIQNETKSSAEIAAKQVKEKKEVSDK